MRSNIWKASVLLAAAVMVLPAFGQSVAATESKDQLVGTWQVQVTQVDCQTGDLLNRESLLRAMEGIECVVHLARAHVKTWAEYQKYIYLSDPLLAPWLLQAR